MSGLHEAGEPPRRHVFKDGLVGLTFSFSIHLLLLAGVGLVQFAVTEFKEHTETGAVITLLPETKLASLDGQSIAMDTPMIGDAMIADAPSSEILEGPGGDAADAAGGDIGEIAEGLGGGGDIGTGGEGLGVGGTGAGDSKFFGVEAAGTRFVYIVDVSGSMNSLVINQTTRLDMLKTELKESIGALLEHMSFYVVMFSGGAASLGGRTKWIDANESGKVFAMKEIGDLTPGGGTEPQYAFDLITESLRPRPSAVYFMTDGQFDPQAVQASISRFNTSKPKVPIYCIALGDIDAATEAQMKAIAADSGGSYTQVKATR